MGDARDVLAIAAHLLRQFGEEAEKIATERAANCRADADRPAALLWRRVARAIRGVQTERRPAGYTRVAEIDVAATLLAARHARVVLEAARGPHLLLKPDLKIAGANDPYLEATMTRRDEIVGRDMFEAFPDNPALPASDRITNLKASLTRVLESGEPDQMPVHRGDVRRRDGPFEQRWWKAVNVPAFGEGGSLLLIIHHVTDVTAHMMLRPA